MNKHLLSFLEFEVGHTHVNLWPLFAVLVFLVLEIIVIFIWLRARFVRLLKDCHESKFDHAILTANKLLKYYQRSYRLTKGKKTKQSIDVINIYLAISYFGLANKELFLETLNLVDDSNKSKHFWLALNDLLEDNFDGAMAHCDRIADDNEFESSIYFLDGILAYKQENFEKSQELLESVYPKLKFAFIKDIAKQFMAEKPADEHA